MSARIPDSNLQRVVIIGGGFAGLRLARKLNGSAFQVVLLDRHNFHQFPPLFYQVATAGLAPSAIAFPLRKAFHHSGNVLFRMCEVYSIDVEGKNVNTSLGHIPYDHLVIATGSDTNYFGNRSIEEHAFPMKSVEESLFLRNRILECMELAVVAETEEEREANMNIVVVGGGPTGVEVSGALAEMKRYVLPKDYPELDFSRMNIYLLEAGVRLLNGMHQKSSEAALKFLKGMDVEVSLGAKVESYDGTRVLIAGNREIVSKTMIWAAGVKGKPLPGIPLQTVAANGRLRVDRFNRVDGLKDIYALGDIAYMEEKGYERGHPQVAQVAIQQASRLARNLKYGQRGQEWKPFSYKDPGSMATIGRSKAVVDLPFYHFQGFFAWLFWLFVHLMNILGVKNRFFIFVDWMWYYLSFDQSLRLVIKQKPAKNSQASVYKEI